VRRKSSDGGDFEIEEEEEGGGDGEGCGGELDEKDDAFVEFEGPAEVPGGAVAAHGIVEDTHREAEEERGEEAGGDSGCEGKGAVLEMLAGVAPGVEGSDEGGSGEREKNEGGEGAAEQEAIKRYFHGSPGSEYSYCRTL
jgi:hypothetical protein